MIVGIDVGGTNTDVVLYDGKFTHVATLKTSDVSDLARVIEDLCPGAKAIGVGLAAWLKRGEVVKAPNIKVIPKMKFSKPFILENDANCFAYFAAKSLGRNNVFGVTIGTGVGSGIVVNGEIYRGCGMAGELGHVYVGGRKRCSCGEIGHVEAYFGGRALKNVRELVETGRIYSTRGFEIFCRALAAAIMVLNPEVVALGGRIGGRLDSKVVEETVMKYVADELKPEFCTINDDLAVAKGAAMLASSIP